MGCGVSNSATRFTDCTVSGNAPRKIQWSITREEQSRAVCGFATKAPPACRNESQHDAMRRGKMFKTECNLDEGF